jgi:CubicO group peptidase (beta-lactamase class C family)
MSILFKTVLLARFFAQAAAAEVHHSPIGTVRQDLRVLESFGFSGAVVISESGHTLLAEGYGTASDDARDRIGTRTLFDIGSIAKQFTAAAILLLEGDKKLKLTDPVARFFPSAPAEIGAITLQQLLTHSGGLSRGNLILPGETTETDPLSRDSAITRIFRSKPRFAPGSQQAYSNAGYVLLAAIVEQASGKSYLDFVRERLWRPARMRDARFWGEATGHIALGKDELGVMSDPRKFPEQDWSLRGAGGIFLSADDLRRWFEALMGGRVLPQSAVQKMMSPQAGTFGYGWIIGPLGGDSTAVYHGGDFPGFGSQLIWQPRYKRLLIILANVRHEDNTYPTRLRVEKILFQRLQGSAVSIPVVQPVSRPTSLRTGVYPSQSGARFRIDRAAGSLVIGALNQEAAGFLSPAVAADSAAYRASLTERTVKVIQAALAKDSATMRRTLSSQDDPPYVLEQLVEELSSALRGREVTDVIGLGTFAAATPAGALWSVAELRTGRDTVHYMLRWHRDVVASYHKRAPSIAARLVVVPSGSGWLAWDIVRSGTVVQIELLDGDQLRLANGVDTMVVRLVQ